MEQFFFDFKIKPNYEIDNFFVGKANQEAYDFLIINKSNNIKNNHFLLVGPTKSGKTHIANIWQKKLVK